MCSLLCYTSAWRVSFHFFFFFFFPLSPRPWTSYLATRSLFGSQWTVSMYTPHVRLSAYTHIWSVHFPCRCARARLRDGDRLMCAFVHYLLSVGALISTMVLIRDQSKSTWPTIARRYDIVLEKRYWRLKKIVILRLARNRDERRRLRNDLPLSVAHYPFVPATRKRIAVSLIRGLIIELIARSLPVELVSWVYTIEILFLSLFFSLSVQRSYL